MFRKYVLPYLLFAVYSALKATWRIEVVETEALKNAMRSGEPMVLAHWHGDELGIIFLLGHYRAAAMTSTSKDGDLMDKVARLFGAETSRGSSTRGGATALKGIIRLARAGRRPSVAVDGPKGPYHKAKAGVFEISRVVGGAIFPLSVAASRAKVFEKSWNKTFLPLPFARVVCVWGEAIPAVAREADPHDPHLARRLEESLADAGRHAGDLARNLIATP